MLQRGDVPYQLNFLYFLHLQVFSLSINDELRREEACLTVVSEGGRVPLESCTGAANQKWKHDKVGQRSMTSYFYDYRKPIKSGNMIR